MDTKQVKKLYFMRHGLTEMNVAGVWSGQTETQLTDEGRAQAKAAGIEARSLGIDTIAASTMDRALETATIVAKEIGYPVENIHTSNLLMERNFGPLEGQTYKPDLDLDGIADVESSSELVERSKVALEWINSLPGDTILIVSHGATGRAVKHIFTPHIPFMEITRLSNAEIVHLNELL